MFFYELIFKIVSIARGYIPCFAGNLQNNSYKIGKAPFEESCSKAAPEDVKQRAKAKRYRFIKVAFVIFIIFLILIFAVVSPLRVFALGYASETIVELILSALAGTAASAFMAAGGAELIVCLLVGMGASIVVSTIAAAINTAVECGAWADFVANCQSNFEVRKEKGTMRLAMGASAFLYAYDWVKEHILGISPEEDDTGSSVSTFYGFKNLGESVWASKSKNSYEKVFNLDNATFIDGFRLNWNNGANRLTHYAKLSSGNVTLNLQAPQLTDIKINSDSTYDYPLVDISLNHYSPIFTKSSCKLATYFIQTVDEDKQDFRKFSGVQNAVIKSCQYVNPSNKTITISLSNYDSSVKKFYVPYSLNSKCSALILKNGKTVTEFNSDLDFAFQFLYKASYYGEFDVKQNSFYWKDPLTATAGPIAIPLENQKYYDKDRDTIATTAGSVRTKVKEGSITSDTAGNVAVKVKTTAPTDTKVTTSTAINTVVGTSEVSTTLEGVKTMNPGDAITIGSNNIKAGAVPIGDKLPFSALKSISNVFNNVFSSKTGDDNVKAPVLPINIKIPFSDDKLSFNIDFSPLDPYVGIVRLGISVSFLITTYILFKKWLVNKEL